MIVYLLHKKYIKVSLYFLLALLTIFLRIYKIDTIPPAMNQDESAIGYNAYSILLTGKDEWGEKFPTYFKSFGDYKLPAYIYSTVPFVKVFGLTPLAVRLPSALAGIAAVFLLLFLVRYLTKNEKQAYISAFLLAINPWHMQFSRSAFEVNFALTAAMAGVLFCIVGLESKRFRYLMIAMIAFVISLYSYNVTRLLSPILAAGVLWLHKDDVRKLAPWKIITLVVTGLVLLIPFIASFFTHAGVFSVTSTLVTSSDIVAKDLEMRSYLINMPQWYVKIFYSKYIYIVYQYFQNLVLLFSGSFFFVTGSGHPTQGIGNVGTFYLFQLPLFIAGIIHYFLNKSRKLRLMMIWLILSAVTLALSKEVPQATRGYFLVVPVIVFSAVGTLALYNRIQKFKPILAKLSLVVIGFAVFYTVQFYLASYFYRFPFVYAKNWQEDEKVLSDYLRKNESKYKKIIISSDTGYVYISYLFYNKYPPQKFIDNQTRYRMGVLQMANSWDKYEIRPIDWTKDAKDEDILLVTDVEHWPRDIPTYGELKSRYTQLQVLSVDEKIFQFPHTDVAYILMNSDQIRNELKRKEDAAKLKAQ